MSANVDIARALNVWLSDGATVMPESITDVVAGRIAGTRQRTLRLPWLSWPSYQTGRLQRVAGLVGILIVAAALGFGLFAGGILNPARPTQSPTSSTPPTSPSPRASAQPTSNPTAESSPSTSNLTAGTHSSSAWLPGVSFTVPAGWSMSDSSEQLTLSSLANDATVTMSNNVYLPGLDTQGCSAPPEGITPHSALDLVNSMTSDTELNASATPTSLGGLQGWIVEFTVGAIAHPCALDNAKPLYTIRYLDGSAPLTIGSLPGLDWRLYVLDGRLDDTIVVQTDGTDPGRLAEAESIVESLEFITPAGPGGPTGPGPLGPITPGTHQTQIWAPTVTFTVAESWNSDWEDSSTFQLWNDSLGEGIDFYWNVYPQVLQDGSCSFGAAWNAPHRPEDVLNGVVSGGLLNATSESTVVGGLRGWLVQGEVPGPIAGCDIWSPFFVRSPEGAANGAYLGAPGDPFRLFVLDDTHGHTIGVVDPTIGTPLTTALIDSIQFNATCDSPPRTRLCEEPSDGVAQNFGDGVLDVTVPDGALTEPVVITVDLGSPTDLPRVLQNRGYDVPLHLIGPEGVTFHRAATVAGGMSFSEVGIHQNDRPDEPLRPVLAFATRTTEGGWEWLTNQSNTYYGNSAAMAGEIGHTGPVFAFVVGINNCGDWEAATKKGSPPLVESRGTNSTIVGGLGAGDPLLERLGLGPVSVTINRNLYFPPMC